MITDESSTTEHNVVQGVDLILGHFEPGLSPPIWPRTISTKATNGRQVLVYNTEETLARFKQANYLDCRINAYPDYTQWNGINRQAPNLIFIDLDLSKFKSIGALSRALNKSLRTIKEKLDNAHPTVLQSGNGYHILQPIEAFVLESESVFATFENPSMRFLRFAEPYLSNNKADLSHGNSLSFKNCMLRIPGSHNSKCVLRNNGITDSNTEVKIIQRWDGRRPAINWLLRDFRRYLIQEKIDVMSKDAMLRRKRSSCCYPTSRTTTMTANHSIGWIDSLLETPIDDNRKYAVWRILGPYLMNVRELSKDEAFNVIRDWLNKCHQLRRLNFNVDQKIRYDLDAVSSYRPISFNNLKEENIDLYSLVSSWLT
jgi:hypothetical protein